MHKCMQPGPVRLRGLVPVVVHRNKKSIDFQSQSIWVLKENVERRRNAEKQRQ